MPSSVVWWENQAKFKSIMEGLGMVELNAFEKATQRYQEMKTGKRCESGEYMKVEVGRSAFVHFTIPYLEDGQLAKQHQQDLLNAGYTEIVLKPRPKVEVEEKPFSEHIEMRLREQTENCFVENDKLRAENQRLRQEKKDDKSVIEWLKKTRTSLTNRVNSLEICLNDIRRAAHSVYSPPAEQAGKTFSGTIQGL